MDDLDASEVHQRLVEASAAISRFNLWSVALAPDRLRGAAAHHLDALTDLADAIALRKELAREGVAAPLGVLDATFDEDSVLPQTSVWAAYRQLVTASEQLQQAMLVKPWEGEPDGWRAASDELGEAVFAIHELEDRTDDFARSGSRPTLVARDGAGEDTNAADAAPEFAETVHAQAPVSTNDAEPRPDAVERAASRRVTPPAVSSASESSSKRRLFGALRPRLR